MKSNTRNVFILTIGLVLGVSLTIGHAVFADKDKPGPLPLNELNTFTEVFSNIKNNYVEPVDDKTLLDNAIRGMLAGLDPHSAYLDSEEFEELQVGTTGEFGGLGIEVGMEDGFVKVISPIDDTPAQKAGIESGDLIIRLDETPVKGLTLKEAVDIMRGKPGTNIVLTVVREGRDKPFKVTIERAIIKVKSVKTKNFSDGYGYVRITQFQSNTGENLVDAIDELKKKNDGKLNGLVLDLRNNPGGVLSAAVAVSDAFLEKGLIVYTEGRVDDSELKFKATPADVISGAPMVVLINGGSASASEIVAGALQDHKRAVIMGTKSFGKGSVQTIIPMKGNTALKLTTARYYTPSGRSIQAEGIVPDIPLEHVKVASVEEPEFEPIKEADLTRHLENNNGKDADKKDKSDKKGSADESKSDEGDDNDMATLAKKDYQLYEALNLLKGLHILKQTKI